VIVSKITSGNLGLATLSAMLGQPLPDKDKFASSASENQDDNSIATVAFKRRLGSFAFIRALITAVLRMLGLIVTFP
jgi:hypothetical protein